MNFGLFVKISQISLISDRNRLFSFGLFDILFVVIGGSDTLPYTIVIIQSDSADAKATASGFIAAGCTVAAMDTDGRNALSLVEQHHPDAIVLDLFLPGRNADEIAELLQEQYTGFLVKIAISPYKCDPISSRFMDSGGDFFLPTPLDYPHTVTRISKALSFHKRRSEINKNPVRQCVWKYLLNISLSLSSNGFVYLQDAVELAIENPGLLRDLTHGLYETIAQRRNSNGPSVERCIRASLDEAFAIGDPELLYKVYGPIINPLTGRPKPGNFIILLTKMVCDDLLIEFRDGM